MLVIYSFWIWSEKFKKRTPITFLHHCIKLLLHILLNTSGWISGDAFWRQPGVPNSLHFPWPSTFNFADFSHYWSAQTIDGQIPFSHTSKKRALICISFGYRTHHNGLKKFMDEYFRFQESYLFLSNYHFICKHCRMLTRESVRNLKLRVQSL